jgi:hypothetical protein
MNKKRVLFGALLVAAVVGGGYLCGSILWNSPSAQVARGSPEAPPKETIHLRGFRQIRGTIYLAAEVVKDVERASGVSGYFSSSSSDGRVRNLVFLDSETLLSHKLFQSNAGVILSTSQYPRASDSEDLQAVEWIVYQIVRQDSNQDGVLNNEDKRIIAVSDVDGRAYVELLEGVDDLYSMDMLEAGRLLVVYMKDAKDYASLIALDSREVIATQTIVPYDAQDE